MAIGIILAKKVKFIFRTFGIIVGQGQGPLGGIGTDLKDIGIPILIIQKEIGIGAVVHKNFLIFPGQHLGNDCNVGACSPHQYIDFVLQNEPLANFFGNVGFNLSVPLYNLNFFHFPID